MTGRTPFSTILIVVPLMLLGMPAGAQSERSSAERSSAERSSVGSDPVQQDAASGRGPIVGGRYRQPTQAEIDARLQQQARGADRSKELDDLYSQALRLSAPKRP